MEEFRKPSMTRPLPAPLDRNSTLRTEALERIRRDVKRIRQRKAQEEQESEEQESEENEPIAPLNGYGVEEKKRLDNAERIEREQSEQSETEQSETEQSEQSATAQTVQTVTHTNGWNQGDGRRAEQIVIYEGKLPESIRARLVPAKGTHFRFRYPADQQALLESLTNATQTATYQESGKKDVTLTSMDGRLLGNIHFLHMDSRDIHHPEKYYMKFYLFNFADSDTLSNTKQRLIQFGRSFSSSRSSSQSGQQRQQRQQRQSRQQRQPRQSRQSRQPRQSRRTHKRHVRTIRPTRRNKMRRTLK